MATLNSHERMYWPPVLEVKDAAGTLVDPQPNPAGGFEASFDRGATWKASRAHPTRPLWACWLIQGPDAGTGVTVDATLTGTTEVIFRRTDTPEILVARLMVYLS